MDLLPWLPALTTTGLLSTALWLGRTMISARLKLSIENEFNEKLEKFRSQVRESEEQIKADIRAREVEIAGLRTGALTALASRQIALDKRRLEAVEQLWSSITALAPARGISALMSTVDFEKTAHSGENNPKIRQVFQEIGANFDERQLDLSGAARARPFLSTMAWAIFSALQAVMLHDVMRCRALSNGIINLDFVDNTAVSNLIKIALPNYTQHIDQRRSSGYNHVLDALDAGLVTELQRMLSGAEADKESLELAANILSESRTVPVRLSSSTPQDGSVL